MDNKKKLAPYEDAQIEIVRFEAGDCITTSDMNFGENEGWNDNLPSGGWT